MMDSRILNMQYFTKYTKNTLLPSTPTIAITTQDYKIRILTPYLQEIGYFKGHKSFVGCLLALPNGELATGSWDSHIKIWSIKNHKLVTTLNKHKKEIKYLCLLKRDRMGSSGNDNCVYIYNIGTWESIYTLQRTAIAVGYNPVVLTFVVVTSIINIYFMGLPDTYDLLNTWKRSNYHPKKSERYGVAGIGYIKHSGNYVIAFEKDILIFDPNFKLLQTIPKDSYNYLKSICILENSTILYGDEAGNLGFLRFNMGEYEREKVINIHRGSVNGIIEVGKDMVVTVSKDKFIKYSDLRTKVCKIERYLADANAIISIVRIMGGGGGE